MYRTILVPIATISTSISVPCRLQQFSPVPHATFLNYSSSSAQDKAQARISQLESKMPYASRISRWIRPARSLSAILSTFSVSVVVGMIAAAKIAGFIEYICIHPLYSCSCSYFWQDSIREHCPE
ncbi:unnamed protein product [Cylicocyclus nassatus]|uniref:Uncharacterized protein n=1 Tax=Cylicocyclus nassatus TaxID=53992 RepID=A0AA36DTL9_CYLNA|nr:unnamed protein product [Cylicocyclus nassatus]